MDISESGEKWKIYYEAAKLEYEYAVTNSSKLDSKAYTLLTVCAFLFTALYTVMGYVKENFVWHISKGVCGYVPVILSSFLLLMAGWYLSKSIFLLIAILNDSKTGRANVYELMNDNIPQEENYEITLRRFAMTYASYTKAGEQAREERHKKLARSIECIYHSLYAIFGMFVILLSGFILQQ